MDRHLLERFCTGDPSAVGELYAMFSGPVFTVAMSILRDRDLAADATQQTFVKAWQGAARFDPDREFGPWIYAIARRATIDLWRRERRRSVGRAIEEVEVAVTPPGIEQTWEAFEVRNALAQLSPEERDVIRLTHFLGLTHDETAERLGIPVGTVKSRSHRAHLRLAALLRHVIEDG